MQLNYILTITLSITISACNPLQVFDSERTTELDTSNTKLSDIETVASANNLFAIDFFKKQSSTLPNQNIFFSPYSLFSSASLLYEGSSGLTKKEMAQVFHFPNTETLRKGYAGIYNQLNNRSNYEMKLANAIWLDKEFDINSEYNKNTLRFYAATSGSLNLTKNPKKSAKAINQFVEKNTQGTIKHVISKDALTNTKVVLTNTVFLKAAWAKPFSEQATKIHNFHLENGETKAVPFMHKRRTRMHYFETESLQMIRLPYNGYSLSALILLPKPEHNAYKSLNAKQLNKWQSSLEPTPVNLYIPKFKIEETLKISDTLASMGMHSAFSNKAEFTKISNSAIKVDTVIHKTFIDLNEEGTVAGAVTESLGAVAASVRQEPKEFRADRPFLFIIKDRYTDTILFMGHLNDPS